MICPECLNSSTEIVEVEGDRTNQQRTGGKVVLKRLLVDELIRLACIYAEQDRRAMAEATLKGSPEWAEANALADQLQAYRMKRWGKTQFEAVSENATTVTIEELRKRLSDG